MSGFAQHAIAQLIEDLRHLQYCSQKNLTENAFGTRSSMCSNSRYAFTGTHCERCPFNTLSDARTWFFTKRGTRFLRNAFSLEIFFAMLWNTFWNAHGTPTGYMRAVLGGLLGLGGLYPSSIRRIKSRPKRTECLAIYWCQCKDSPFSSIILRPWGRSDQNLEPWSAILEDKNGSDSRTYAG